jgi:hypothetical protein
MLYRELVLVFSENHFFQTRQPLVGQGLLIVEASFSRSDPPTLDGTPLDE